MITKYTQNSPPSLVEQNYSHYLDMEYCPQVGFLYKFALWHLTYVKIYNSRLGGEIR